MHSILSRSTNRPISNIRSLFQMCPLFHLLIVLKRKEYLIHLLFSVFTVRRYALHGLSYRNSVRLSVRLSVTFVHCVHTVQPTMTISSPYGSPIILVSGGYHDYPKIRRGSPRARALNEGGVGPNWRFSTNKSPYLRNGARYDKGYY